MVQLRQLQRYAVFIITIADGGHVGWRFNACFSTPLRAFEEARWYIAHNYQVAVEPVPDDVRKYNWKGTAQ